MSNITENIENYKPYLGNINIKRQGVQVNWTPELLMEYVKCSQDPVYFCETYMKIINVDEGLVPFRLYDYQKEMMTSMADNRYTIITTARQIGKALPLNTAIPTPDGWKTIADLRAGDRVFGADGQPVDVIATSDIFKGRKCYEFTFDTGETVVSDEEHLWTVWYTPTRKYRTLTTKQMVEIQQQAHESRRNSYFAVQVTKPVQYQSTNVDVDPYTLGVWLGDGTSASGAITCTFEDLVEYKQNINMVFGEQYNTSSENSDHIYTGTIYDLAPKLKQYRLLNNKHIPAQYLYNDINTRVELLRGLMDTDGWVSTQTGTCSIQLSNKNQRLLDDVLILLRGLGLKVYTMRFPKTNSTRYSFFVGKQEMEVFKLSRKLALQPDLPRQQRYTKHRYIRKIEQVDSVDTKCISVNNSDNLFLCTTSYIPTHNSTVTCGFILWYIIFHSEKTVALLANKGETAREILGKIQLAYEHLPKWLQQGVVEWNKGSFELENNSRVVAAATSASAIRGYAINLLFIDEAAFIENWDEFFTSVFPTISSGKSTKVILVSTPNGLNHYYKLWSDAQENRNSYNPIEVIWSRVPGRDERWKQETIAAMGGDIEKFSQEHSCQFIGSTSTLISGSKLKQLVFKHPLALPNSESGFSVYETPKSSRVYILTGDTSQGKGLDYSAFQIIDITQMPYKQVCVYKDNRVSPSDYAEIIYRTAQQYNDCMILLETNDMGQSVCDTIYNEYEYENMLFTETAGRAGKRLSSGFGRANTKDIGLRTSRAVKAVGCSMLKLLIEQDQLIVNDFDTIKELNVFSKKGNSYEAEPGHHDDLVMSLVLFAWASNQKYFRELTDIDTLKFLREKSDEEIETDVLPFGFINSGHDIYDGEEELLNF